jgi:hypothetical protein
MAPAGSFRVLTGKQVRWLHFTLDSNKKSNPAFKV